jgi:hypothetical protein
MLTESSKPNASKGRFVCGGYPANFGEERPFDGQHFVKVELPLLADWLRSPMAAFEHFNWWSSRGMKRPH